MFWNDAHFAVGARRRIPETCGKIPPSDAERVVCSEGMCVSHPKRPFVLVSPCWFPARHLGAAAASRRFSRQTTLGRIASLRKPGISALLIDFTLDPLEVSLFCCFVFDKCGWATIPATGSKVIRKKTQVHLLPSSVCTYFVCSNSIVLFSYHAAVR